MIKNILKFIRFWAIGFMWTGIYGYLVRLFLIKFWQFDILYRKQWIVIKGFWNSNGVIHGVSDYLLLVSMFILLLIWGWGWYRLYKINYGKKLVGFVNYISGRGLKKYEESAEHVVIKNLKVGEKLTVEDVIQDRIKQEKTEKSQEAGDLRKKVSEKIVNYREQ